MKVVPLQDARELVGVSHQGASLAVLLLFGCHYIEVGGLHRGIPGVERSPRDERVVQGVAWCYKKMEKKGNISLT